MQQKTLNSEKPSKSKSNVLSINAKNKMAELKNVPKSMSSFGKKTLLYSSKKSSKKIKEKSKDTSLKTSSFNCSSVRSEQLGKHFTNLDLLKIN
jgi:hypothetical protein